MPRLSDTIFFVFTLILLSGCMRPQTIKVADTDPAGWRGQDTVSIRIDNSDTISRRQLTLLFRFDETFAIRSIPLRIRVTTPDSLWYEEGFAAVPASSHKANNGFHEAAVPYRNDVKLAQQGRYMFDIVNAGGEIRGMWGLGMMIE